MKLTLTTSYAESWRYNIMVTLAVLDENGEQVGYHSAEESPLPVGSNSSEAPEGFVRRREVSIEFESCEKVRFYIYLLPNSLPEDTTLAGVQTTFPLQIKLTDGSKSIFAEKLEVNRFGGCGKEYIVACH
ncbi:MAG: hypothetical protein IJB23_06765 [Alistipes sp.]|nr:hypothetical protein [Alistipes sp.]MBQ3209502.1 hypothetical protein [Alistipes sp.]